MKKIVLTSLVLAGVFVGCSSDRELPKNVDECIAQKENLTKQVTSGDISREEYISEDAIITPLCQDIAYKAAMGSFNTDKPTHKMNEFSKMK